MKLKHIDPMGGGRVAALGMRLVDRDEVVDVPDDIAPLLLVQTLNWEPADKAAEKLAATAVPEFEAALVANNIVDGAQMGVSIANFASGGRIAVAPGRPVATAPLPSHR